MVRDKRIISGRVPTIVITFNFDLVIIGFQEFNFSRRGPQIIALLFAFQKVCLVIFLNYSLGLLRRSSSQ
jgi:hypothetical protein